MYTIKSGHGHEMISPALLSGMGRWNYPAWFQTYITWTKTYINKSVDFKIGKIFLNFIMKHLGDLIVCSCDSTFFMATIFKRSLRESDKCWFVGHKTGFGRKETKKWGVETRLNDEWRRRGRERKISALSPPPMFYPLKLGTAYKTKLWNASSPKVPAYVALKAYFHSLL